MTAKVSDYSNKPNVKPPKVYVPVEEEENEAIKKAFGIRGMMSSFIRDTVDANGNKKHKRDSFYYGFKTNTYESLFLDDVRAYMKANEDLINKILNAA